MSQIVTPPDIVSGENSYLLINPTKIDLEMIIHWLRLSERNCTIHLYREDINNLDWLDSASRAVSTILIAKEHTKKDLVLSLLNYPDKLIWFGESLNYQYALEYFMKNDRTN